MKDLSKGQDNKEVERDTKLISSIGDIPYGPMGYREFLDSTWYPTWTIEYLTRPDDVHSARTETFGAYGKVDLIDKLKEISKANPDTEVTLSAFARVRMVARHGNITKTHRYKDFYTVDSEADKVAAHVFDNLVSTDNDGMGKHYFGGSGEVK